MPDAVKPRSNTARRTRRALLDAATRLLCAGGRPTLEEVAEEALVSRATAYRYFTGVEPLLVEAALDVAMPSAAIFEDDASPEPLQRLLRADEAVHDMVLANEAAIRTMLIHSLKTQLQDGDAPLPTRQNRRTPLIAAALEPAKGRFAPAQLDRLTKALAMLIGTEWLLVFRDVLQLSDAEAREIKAWMIAALLEASAKPA